MNGCKKYLFTYRHGGACWGIEIPADSPADAKLRIANMQYATYEGEVHATVPAHLGLLARLWVVIRNLLKAQPAA